MAVSINDYSKKFKTIIDNNRQQMTHLSKDEVEDVYKSYEKQYKNKQNELHSKLDEKFQKISEKIPTIEISPALPKYSATPQNKIPNNIRTPQDVLHYNLQQSQKRLKEVEADEEIKKLRQEKEKLYDKTGKSYNIYLDKKLEEDDIGWFDKSFGSVISGIGSMLPSKYEIKNENGNYYRVKNYSERKQEKILNSYESKLGKLYGTATYELGKIGATAVVSSIANMIVPGSGFVGTAVYYGDIFADSYNRSLEEGYTGNQAMTYATISSASEMAIGKLLGGTSKALGMGSSELSKSISKQLTNKLLINHPHLANALSSAVSEGSEEFVQEFLDKFNRNVILDEKNLRDSLNGIFNKSVLEDALYSGLVGSLTGMVTGGFDGTNYNNVEESNNLNNNQSSETFNQSLKHSLANNQNNIYTYESSENSKINNLKKSASKYFNNSEQTHNFINNIEKIILDKNYNVIFDTNIKNKGKNVNAQIKTLNNGEIEIRINPNSSKSGEFLIMHEVTHAIENNSMKKLVMDYASKHSDFNTALESLKTTYGVDDVSSEVLADISGQLFGNQEFINNLSVEQPSIFKKIYDAIISLANKITGNTNEALFIRDLKNKWETAYRTQNNNLNETSYSFMSDKGLENALKTNPNNQNLVQRLSIAEQMKLNNYSNEEIRQKTMWFQDPSGRWLFEITDKDAQLKTDLEKNKTYKHLEEIFEHDRLFEAYPELKNIKVITKNIKADNNGNEVGGYYNPLTKTITLNNKYLDKSRKILLHELQHKIQQLEGLDIGKTNNSIRYYTSLGEIMSSEVEKRADMSYFEIKQNAPEVAKKYPIHPYLKKANNNLDSNFAKSLLADKNVAELYNEIYNKDVKGEYNRAEINKKGYIKNQESGNKGILFDNGRRRSDSNTKQKSIQIQEELDNSSFSMQNNKWQQYLEKNYKTTGTRTNLQDIKLPIAQKINPSVKLSINNNSTIPNQSPTKESAYETDYEKRKRKDVQEELLEEMGITIHDLDVGEDISSIAYQRTDPIRLNEKVFGHEIGQKINDATINKTKHNEAERIRYLNKERNEIKNLGIKPQSKESAAVQKYGEKQYVNEYGEVIQYGDKELISEFSNIETQNKIKNAAKVIRGKYDTYIDQINSVLIDMGYNPIKKRTDYMRHFQALNDLFSKFGMPLNRENLSQDSLPTDINGITDQFKPGKNWFANAMQRLGKDTALDAITGIDGYLDGASNLIYHTEDIQRYRTLSKLIRQTYGQTHGLDNIENMSKTEVQQRLADIHDNKLSKYVAWLDEQANALAGKKGAIDRGVERFLGRKIYSILDTAKKQVGSNMTGFNVRSALTNFASSVQGAAKTNKLAFVKGTISTIQNIVHNDDLIKKSDFLTSRFGSDKISQKLWQKASNAGQILMRGSDYFTANQIWRSKYFENLQNNMSESEAIKKADDFASRVMGDRSKGMTAEIFNSKTLGMLTQFQLEVNNQWSSLIHDNKMDIQSGKKTGATVIFQLGQLAAMSYMFNNFMRALTGSDVMFDPIDILKKLLGIDDEDEEKTLEERSFEVIGHLIDDLPFVSFLTGGRIPISEAFSGTNTLIKKVSDQTDDYGNKIKWKDVGNDLAESAFYWLLPTGYGQIKKTTKGLSMYDKKLPLAGSYTASGNLRFTAEDTTEGKIKAALFGEYSSEEAQKYIDSGFNAISSKRIQEIKDLNMTTSEYRKYNDGLKASGTTNADKIDYIANSNYSDKQKNIMAKNILDRDFDIKEYKKYGSYEEYDYAYKNPKKYAVISNITTYDKYNEYKIEIEKIRDNTSNDKNETIKYINSLKLNIPQKAMFIKLYYPSFDDYNEEIINYINNKKITMDKKITILTKLDFEIKDGVVYW